MPPKTPLISVVMATFNGLPYLREQLASILSQTRSPDEIVICDDTSTDGTWDYLSEVSAADPRVHIHKNASRLGSTKNFERAISLSRGDVIFFSDQDDVWHPKKVEVMIAAMSDSGAALVMSNGKLINADGDDLGATLWQANRIDPTVARVLQSELACELLAARNYFSGGALCVRGALARRSIPIPSAAWHDQWIALIASVAEPGRLLLLDELLYSYRQHDRNQIGAAFPLSAPRGRGIYLHKVWKEVMLHEDISRSIALCNQTIECLTAAIGKWAIGPGALPHKVRIALQERVRHAAGRCSFIEHRLRWRGYFTTARLDAYRRFDRGWTSIIRDVLARLLYPFRGRFNPQTESVDPSR